MDLYQPWFSIRKIPWFSFETDGSMQTKHGNGFVFHPPGKAGREWTWPMGAGQCRHGVFVVAKSLQILGYLWMICGWFVGYLWIICGLFVDVSANFCWWKTCKVDWFWWSKSKSWDLCHPLYTLSFKRNLLDATVARAILSLQYEKAVPWDRNCCMVVIFSRESYKLRCMFLLKDAPKHKKE